MVGGKGGRGGVSREGEGRGVTKLSRKVTGGFTLLHNFNFSCIEDGKGGERGGEVL